MAKKRLVVTASEYVEQHSAYGDRRDELSDCVIGTNGRIYRLAGMLESMAESLRKDGADQLAIIDRMREELTQLEQQVRARDDYALKLQDALTKG